MSRDRRGIRQYRADIEKKEEVAKHERERVVTNKRGKENVGRQHIAGSLSLARILSRCVRQRHLDYH